MPNDRNAMRQLRGSFEVSAVRSNQIHRASWKRPVRPVMMLMSKRTSSFSAEWAALCQAKSEAISKKGLIGDKRAYNAKEPNGAAIQLENDSLMTNSHI